MTAFISLSAMVFPIHPCGPAMKLWKLNVVPRNDRVLVGIALSTTKIYEMPSCTINTTPNRTKDAQIESQVNERLALAVYCVVQGTDKVR